jgi:hypothetical protein
MKELNYVYLFVFSTFLSAHCMERQDAVNRNLYNGRTWTLEGLGAAIQRQKQLGASFRETTPEEYAGNIVTAEADETNRGMLRLKLDPTLSAFTALKDLKLSRVRLDPLYIITAINTMPVLETLTLVDCSPLNQGTISVLEKSFVREARGVEGINGTWKRKGLESRPAGSDYSNRRSGY